MAYSYITFGQLKSQMADRLGDPSKVFYTDSELGLYLTEALRMWGGLTGYWRSRSTFPTVASTVFYDLPTQMPGLLSYDVTDRDLIRLIQYHLMENASAQDSWLGTDMFTLDQVTKAIQRRRDQFIQETNCRQVHSTLPMPSPIGGRIALPDTTIDVRRAVWYDSESPANYSTLWRSSEWEFNSYSQTWNTNPDTPLFYSVALTPPVTLQAGPVPVTSGTLDLVTLDAGGSLDPANQATLLTVPDNYCWAVKWGVIADLLTTTGQSTDIQRAAYCEQMYGLGVQAARLLPTVLGAQLQGLQVTPISLQEADSGYPNWQGETAGQPQDILTAGNLVALRDTPDGVYSVLLDVVGNAVVPQIDSDDIQVGREELNTILDLACHIAAFKEGGAEFTETQAVLQNAVSSGQVYAERLNAAVSYAEILQGLSQREASERPQRESRKPFDYDDRRSRYGRTTTR